MSRSLIVAVALSIGLATSAALAAGEPAASDKAAKGAEVFAAQHCSMCHAVAGKGNAKNPLDDVGDKMSADDIRKYIVSPKSVKADSKMKAYPNLPAEDLDALVAYLTTLKKKS